MLLSILPYFILSFPASIYSSLLPSLLRYVLPYFRLSFPACIYPYSHIFLSFPASVYSSFLPSSLSCFRIFFVTSFFPSLFPSILPQFPPSAYSSFHPAFRLCSVFPFLRPCVVFSSLLPSLFLFILPSFHLVFHLSFPSHFHPLFLCASLTLSFCVIYEASNTVTCRCRLLLMLHIVLSVAQDTSRSHVCCTKNPIHSSLVPHIAPLRALNAYVISHNSSVCGLNVKLPFSRRCMYDLTCRHFSLFYLSVLY